MKYKEKPLQLKQLYYTIKEVEELQKEADEKGITFSEQVRRALDFYLDFKKNDHN